MADLPPPALCNNTLRRQPSASQEESPHPELNQPAPRDSISSGRRDNRVLLRQFKLRQQEHIYWHPLCLLPGLVFLKENKWNLKKAWENFCCSSLTLYSYCWHRKPKPFLENWPWSCSEISCSPWSQKHHCACHAWGCSLSKSRLLLRIYLSQGWMSAPDRGC